MFYLVRDQIPLWLMSHLSRNWLELLLQEYEEASGAGYEAAFGGAAAPACRPAHDQHTTKCAFAGDVDMPQAGSESYEQWTQWRDHVATTFRAFLSYDVVYSVATAYW